MVIRRGVQSDETLPIPALDSGMKLAVAYGFFSTQVPRHKLLGCIRHVKWLTFLGENGSPLRHTGKKMPGFRKSWQSNGTGTFADRRVDCDDWRTVFKHPSARSQIVVPKNNVEVSPRGLLRALVDRQADCQPKLDSQVTFRVTEDEFLELTRISNKAHRTTMLTARLIFRIGLKALQSAEEGGVL